MTVVRRARVVAAVLAADAIAHLYWTTGATWPAADRRSLSDAVLGGEARWDPPVLLPLAALLLTAAATVLARARLGRRHRLGGLLQVATVGLTAGLLCRALLGVVWAFGIGVSTDSAFYWLNLLVYTPTCLALGALTGSVARDGVTGRAWPRRTAIAVPLVLIAALLVTAYGYQPAEQPRVQPDPRSRYVETPVARFHYLRQGSGSPVVLLSPGAAPTAAWDPQLAALSWHHTVYVVDLPGQGYTELRDRHFRFDLDGMTTALGSFLDALRIGRTALAGNSWSGGWGLAYAQRHPERVDRLMLLAPSGIDQPDPLSWRLLKLPAVGEAMAKVGTSRSVVASAVRPLFAHPERATDAIIDEMWVPSTFADNVRSMYELERGLDWRITEAALPRTSQPTLLLWGREDTVNPVAWADRFAGLLPSATVRLLDGCGHALTVDCPDQVSALMGDFLGDR